ncbi:hypothetical protein BH18THE2_BH18THE2_42670 [soil metagenome]
MKRKYLLILVAAGVFSANRTKKTRNNLSLLLKQIQSIVDPIPSGLLTLVKAILCFHTWYTFHRTWLPFPLPNPHYYHTFW